MGDFARRIQGVIVEIGKERIPAVGAAAAIIVQILLHANEFNAMALGSVRIDWSNGKASLRISKSFEPVGFDL
ncbi:MAG TPA: hypothetical protein VFC51_15210 [Chloroflexota bacterium]|nr:hypothetical protein [Chloroflexota bacterium]